MGAAEHIFKIPIIELSEPKIYIHIYDDDSALRDTFLGEVLLGTQAILALMATPGKASARVVRPLALIVIAFWLSSNECFCTQLGAHNRSLLTAK